MLNSADYQIFTRRRWSEQTKSQPIAINEAELAGLASINEQIALAEVEQIYWPLVEYLALRIVAYEQLNRQLQCDFFRDTKQMVRRPFMIAVAGSVAVGKSTFARLLHVLLQRKLTAQKVALVTTDGFLYPNATLKEKGIFDKKGFPQSYDTAAMIEFLSAAKRAQQQLSYKVYSHELYDIEPGQQEQIELPDVLLIEGLNVLQAIPNVSSMSADFFDFSIYLDARESDIRRWFVERFFQLQQTVFANPKSFFHNYKNMSQQQAKEFATKIWQQINLVNLKENIEPTKSRANMLIRKSSNHQIAELWLRNF